MAMFEVGGVIVESSVEVVLMLPAGCQRVIAVYIASHIYRMAGNTGIIYMTK